MIVSVVREHHWSPEVIGGLFLDEIDRFGLIFWYNDILEMHEQSKKNK